MDTQFDIEIIKAVPTPLLLVGANELAAQDLQGYAHKKSDF